MDPKMHTTLTPRGYTNEDKATAIAEQLSWAHNGPTPEPDEGHLYHEWALDNGLDPDHEDTIDIWIWGPYLDTHPNR